MYRRVWVACRRIRLMRQKRRFIASHSHVNLASRILGIVSASASQCLVAGINKGSAMSVSIRCCDSGLRFDVRFDVETDCAGTICRATSNLHTFNFYGINMKTFASLVTSIAAVMLLTACVSNSNSAPPATSMGAAASGTMYCFKDRFYETGSELVCNWSKSADAACTEIAQSSRIAVSAAAGAPVTGKRCANGQWLLQVTMK